LTTAPLRLYSAVFLHVQDGLLAEEDEKLPFAGHVVSAPQHFHLIEDFVFIVFMRTEEVVVSDPEGKVIVGTVDVIKAVCMAVGSLIGAVEPFNHLFEWAVFRRNGIVVDKPNDLSDLERKVFAKLLDEFHCGERIGAVAVSDELKVLRQFCKSLESHAHGKNAGADAAVVGYPVADNGAGCRIHDEPDIGFDAADFNVGFVSGEDFSFLVRILVNKGFDAQGRSFAVISDLPVGDADVVEVFKGL